MTCPNCGAPNGPNRGAPNGPNRGFCGSCGHPIGQ